MSNPTLGHHDVLELDTFQPKDCVAQAVRIRNKNVEQEDANLDIMGNEDNKEEPQSEPKKTNPPCLPFPQRVKSTGLDKQYKKVLDVFKRLDISIPLLEAITQMPKYAKFLKKIITNKKKWEEFETITMNEECSAVIQNKLPPKLKDPRSIIIPCVIGKMSIGQALCDLGASASLMPLSLCRKLNIRDPKPTTILL